MDKILHENQMAAVSRLNEFCEDNVKFLWVLLLTNSLPRQINS